MKFRSTLFLLAAVILFIIFPAARHLDAQTKNNLTPSAPGATTRAGDPAESSVTKAAAKQPDIAESANPQVVKTYSEEQLNDLFDRLVSRYSKDAVLFNNVGAAYYGFKMYDKAENAMRRAIALNNHPAFLTNLSILYDVQERLSEAITMARRAISQAPRFVRARSQLCMLILESKHDADAILCYDEMAKFTALDPLDQAYYATALVHTKSYEKAVNMLAPLTKAPQPTAMVFNVLGNAYYLKKRYTQAADAFKQAVEIEPDSPQLRYNLALCLTTINNRAGAMSQYNLVKEKDPSLADQLYKLIYRDKIIFVDEQTASKNPR